MSVFGVTPFNGVKKFLQYVDHVEFLTRIRCHQFLGLRCHPDYLGALLEGNENLARERFALFMHIDPAVEMTSVMCPGLGIDGSFSFDPFVPILFSSVV